MDGSGRSRRATGRTQIRTSASILLGLVISVGATFGEDWSVAVGKNPLRNGLASVIGPAGPQILWEGGRDSILADQPVCEGGLMVSTRMEGWDAVSGSLIVAQDVQTGQERWTTILPALLPNPGRSRVIGFRDGRVYATRSAGSLRPDYLFALDPANGGVLWQSTQLVAEAWGESVGFTQDGDVLVRGTSGLLRISKEDGRTVWAASLPIPVGSCGAASFGNRVYVWEAVGGGVRIRALDATTGAKLYLGPALGSGTLQQTAPFVGADGTVYAPRSQDDPATDYLVAYQDTGTALVEKWRSPLGFVPSASFAVSSDGHVYSYATTAVGSSATLRVRKLRAQDGALVAESSAVASDYPVQPRLALDRVGKAYVTNGGYARGRLVVLDSSLTALWSETVPDIGKSGPVLVSDGILVVAGAGTHVRAYGGLANVSGVVELQQRMAITGMRSVLEFREPGAQRVLHSCPIILDAQGRFGGCTVPPGTYDLALRFPHFLRQVRPARVLGIGPNEVSFSLMNGDVDDNNAIGLADLSAILVRFSSSDPSADRNGDGIVGLTDLNLVLLNFGLVGAP